jgi:hypothetical protein
MTTNYPTSLDELNAGIGTDSQSLSNPNHVTQHQNESDAIEALQAKVGIDSSADTDSIDYKLTNASSVSPGHKHVSADISDLLPISSSTGVADAGKLVKTNASGVLDLSFTIEPIIRTYTTSGSPHTWTKPTGLKYVIVELVGAGGGGQGSINNGNDGAGGGGGGYSRKKISVASLGLTETITIGAGGGGGGPSGGVGTTGGTTSFGSLVTATGGFGGGVSNQRGGLGASGDINSPGGDGEAGQGTTRSGTGGNSLWGQGGFYTTSGGGNAGGNYGSGGSGGSSGGASGGAGAGGYCIVTEYYN